MKLVVNKCYGGFDLSKKAEKMLGVDSYDVERNDPKLVQIVEELGEEASSGYAELRVVEIPDEATDFDISEYDGFETVVYVVNGKIKYA